MTIRLVPLRSTEGADSRVGGTVGERVALVAADARFMIVGAHALSAHGVPRATVDLDIWIDATPGNAKRVWAALAAFGAPLESLRIRESDLADIESLGGE